MIEQKPLITAKESDTKAYESCYNWYINVQKVLPSNAELAAKVWVNKYCLHDSDGIALEATPEDMWRRLAKTLSAIEVKTNTKTNKTKEEWEQIFYNTFSDFKYVLGGSGLSAVGNYTSRMSASNCYVIRPPQDSMDDIFRACKDMANIQKYRGGTGVDISNLRPCGAGVSNAAKESSGAVSFMDLLSKVTATVGQRGRCLFGTQNILTNRGLLQIKDVKSGDLIWTSKGWITNINTLYNGKKLGYKLTTKSGYEITATDNHILTYENNFQVYEKPLSEFLVGDKICLLPGTTIENIPYINLNTVIDYKQKHKNNSTIFNHNIKLPTQLTEDLAYYLGYSFGDGCVEVDKFKEPVKLFVACSHDYPEIEQNLVAAIKTTFEYTCNSIPQTNTKMNKVFIYSKLICLFLAQNGLLKQKHNKLELPELIKQSKTSVQMAFISGYFDADGCAKKTAHRGYFIKSVCLPILKDIQNLLMGAGIVSNISHSLPAISDKYIRQDIYSLSIKGTYSQTLALKLLNYSIKLNNAYIVKVDTIHTPYNYKTLKLVNSHPSATITAGVYSSVRELNKLDNILIIDTVSSIDPVDISDVYDLELKEHHLFYCQGFNVHNSGATMISIRSSHPDVERFIEEKQDLDKQSFFKELAQVGINIEDWKYTPIATRLKSTTKANVSVRVDDAFMNAVEANLDYNLWFNFPKDSKYTNINKSVQACNIWHKLVAANVKAAEPGLLFWDTIIKQSIPDCYGAGKALVDGLLQDYDFTTLGVNPCAELSLNNDACSIGSLFLYQFVKNPFTVNASFDFEKFEKIARLAIRIQDNVREYDMDYLPLPEYKISAVLGRRIGIGIHGLADTLAALGLKYDTEEAIKMAEHLSSYLKNVIYDESVVLGQEKGVFPIWDWEKEKNNPYLKTLSSQVYEKIKLYGRRNIACQTIAPTGSISILSRNCSSGIEPVFMLKYNRAIKKQGSEETVLHVINHQALQDCIDAKGNTSVFVEANNIDWKLRIFMQAACQKNIDHSISSTINLPKGTTEETVSEIYMTAWKAGLKGVTTYVEGSRTGVLTSMEQPQQNKTHRVMERPKTTDIDIFKTRYKEKSYMILVGKVDGMPCEVFGGEETGLSLPTKYKSATLTKKSRGHYTLNIQLSEDEEDILKVNNLGNLFPAGDVITIARMISMSLRNGIAVSEIVEQLAKSGSSLYDAPTVFARVLKNYIPEEEIIEKELAKGKKCPECGNSLDYKRESGCLTEICPNCSYSNSKCG